MGGSIVIVCGGGCGKTTDDVSATEFWKGRVEHSPDPGCLVPVWTCRECIEVCECGDYRYQHEDHKGKCKVSTCNQDVPGAGPCQEFRLSAADPPKFILETK